MFAPNAQIKVAKLLMIQTNTYNDQVIRPYGTNMSTDHLAVFREATQYGENVSAGSLAGIAGSFLRPQAEMAGGVQMYNGWDLHRVRFLMTLAVPMGAGAYNYQLIAGYSDHYGVSQDGVNIDPNMRLFFNSTLSVNACPVDVPGVGAVNQMRVAEAAQILAPPPGYTDGSAIGTHTMRPEDIMNACSTSGYTDGTRMDMRTNFSMAPVKKSMRTNTIAADYLSKTMSAVNQAMQVDARMQQETMYAEARGTVVEPLLLHDPFIAIIAARTRFKETGYITYAELCSIFPETDHVREQIIQGAAQQTLVPGRGQSEYWHVPTNETVVATILSQAVPALMLEVMLSKVSFIATNDNINGQPDLGIVDHRSFAEGINAVPHCNHFRHRFLTEVMRDITHNNMMTVYLAVTCSVIGDTVITVSLNGGPKIDYVVPSFCDSMFSPLITTNHLALNTMATDIETLNSALIVTKPDNFQLAGMPTLGNPFGYAPSAAHANLNDLPQGEAHVGSAIISAI